MNNNTLQIVIAVLLGFLLLVLGDLIPFWMPGMTEMIALLCVVLLLTIWAGFVMYEHARDERDEVNKMHAGRVAYLSGIGTLTLALLVQGISHTIDPWITVSLAVMVISKLLARMYTERNR
jgi:predicted ABC-type exoprotein transport system permease subunit